MQFSCEFVACYVTMIVLWSFVFLIFLFFTISIVCIARSKTWLIHEMFNKLEIFMLLFSNKLNNFWYCRYKPSSWKYLPFSSVHFMDFGTSKSYLGTYSFSLRERAPYAICIYCSFFILKMLSETLIITCSAVYKSKMLSQLWTCFHLLSWLWFFYTSSGCKPRKERGS